MRAVRLVAPGRVEVDDVPVPEPGPGEVLLRTLAASVCGSDLHSIFGDVGEPAYPAAPGHPGHESVGEVVESRSASFKPGQLVLAVPDPPESRSFADYQAVGEDFLVGLPPGADPAVMVIAQQLGTVVYALKRIWPGPAAEVAAVIGAGPAGLQFTQLLRQRGFARIVVADLSPARLRKAKELGADVTALAGEESVVDAVMDATGGQGADLVVDAAGRDETRAQAVTAVRVGGRVGMFGLPERSGDAPFPFAVAFRRMPSIEIVYGAQREPGLASFRSAVADIDAGRLEAAALISHTFSIADAPEAIALAHERRDDAVKVRLTFDT